MPIPSNITSEDVVKAVREIESKGNIPPSRDAIWYYIEYDGKIYPMKYVVSIANKFKNGKPLKPRDFDARQAYSLLKKLEFKIFQYWIFQALPKKWPDVIDVLSQKERVSWYVKQHKKYVSQGHKVIIWIAGQNAGCYALGEVDSDTYPVVEDNKQYSKPD